MAHPQITVFARSAQGEERPIRIIQGLHTQLYRETRNGAIGDGVPCLRVPGNGLRATKGKVTRTAWWDYVDAIATRQFGEVLRKHTDPEEVRRYVRRHEA